MNPHISALAKPNLTEEQGRALEALEKDIKGVATFLRGLKEGQTITQEEGEYSFRLAEKLQGTQKKIWKLRVFSQGGITDHYHPGLYNALYTLHHRRWHLGDTITLDYTTEEVE